MDVDWKTVAAVWGAVLSTWLFLEKLFGAKPLVFIEPMAAQQTRNAQYLNIRIHNPTDKPVHFHAVRVLRPRDCELHLLNQEDGRKPFQPNNVLVYPGREIILRTNISGWDRGLTVLVWWEFTNGSSWWPRPILIFKSRRWLDDIQNLNERRLTRELPKT